MNTNAPIKDASVLGVPKMLILGLQHLFAMFGATILVPILDATIQQWQESYLLNKVHQLRTVVYLQVPHLHS